MAANIPTNVDGSWTRGTPSWSAGFLHLYPITMTLGVLFSFLSICYFWKRQKYSWEILQVMLIIIVPTSLLGARFWFVLWDGGWDQFWKFQGLSIHGGVFISTFCVSLYLYTKKNLVDYRTVFSIVLPNVILGQVIGRWGNFDNHEVFGRVVSGDSLNWMGAMKSHMFIALENESTGYYRAPLFFYEFMANGFGYVFMVWILLKKNWLKPGTVGTVYLIWYGIVRLSMEPLRDPTDIMGEGHFRISVFVACVSIVFGIIFFAYFQFFDVPLRNFFLRKSLEKKNNKFLLAMTKVFNAKDFEKIVPVKPIRKYLVWGELSDYKKKYLFWGPQVENRQIIWLPAEDDIKWSKADLKRGEIPHTKKAKHKLNQTKSKPKLK